MAVRDLLVSDLDQVSIERSEPFLDLDRVAYYAEHLDDSAPVVVFDVGGILLLADGHHRVAAAKSLGRPSISADVRRGAKGDALRFAVELAQQERGLTKEQIIEAITRRGPSPKI